MEPLLEECPVCKGTGRPPDPPPQPGGSFRHVVRYDPNPCSGCNGRGNVLTDAGRAVAAVFEHMNNRGR